MDQERACSSGARWVRPRAVDGAAILIIAPDLEFQAVLTRSLERQSDFDVVGRASTLSEAELQLSTSRPDVVVLEPRLPDASGADAMNRIRSKCPDARLLLVLDSALESAEATRTGLVDGIIQRSSPVSWIVTAIRGLLHASRGPVGPPPDVA